MAAKKNGNGYMTWREYAEAHERISSRVTVLETQYSTIKWLLGSNLLITTAGILGIIVVLVRFH